MRTRTKQLAVFFATGLVLLIHPGCGSKPPQDPGPTDFLITTTFLNFATVGKAYSFQLETINGVPPLTWEISSGAPPPNIVLAADTGLLSGTTDTIGSFFFSVKVTDSSATPQEATADVGIAAVRETGGAVSIVSDALGLAQTNDHSAEGRGNSNGRYAVYSSLATNISTGDTNNRWDIFVRDTCRDQDPQVCTPFSRRVSLGPDDAQGDGNSRGAWISTTGRYVAFASQATTLIAGDTNNAQDIFLRDTCIGEDPDICVRETVRVSLAADGSEALGDSVEPSMSSDGRFVAFRSLANNLVAGDGNGAGDVFVRDTCLGQDPVACTPTTIRASVSSSGTEGNGNSIRPRISPDGRFVAFESFANNLVAGDNNGTADIFVRDTCLGAPLGCTPTTIRASLADDGSEPNTASFRASVSGGGRYVAFDSSASNLIATDQNGVSDVFVRDTCLGATAGCVPATFRVSLDETNGEFGAPPSPGDPRKRYSSTEASISGDGRVIAFRTKSLDLPESDPNAASEIYVRDTCAGQDPAVCAPATFLASLADNGQRIDRDALQPFVSEDGTAVFFHSASSVLVSGDANFRDDVFFVNLVDFLTRP